MGRRLIRANLPCSSCNSSDALAVYDNGTYCFSCRKFLTKDKSSAIFSSYKESNREAYVEPMYSYGSFFLDRGRIELDRDSYEYTYQYLEHRGISKATYAYYGAEVKVDAEGSPLCIGFPYGSYTIVRDLDKKHYTTKGDSSAPRLFGQEKFQAGGSKTITVTEGAYDALSLYEILRYPCVSVRSASTARSDCERQRDWLNSFDSIYLCFDADKPGEEATREVAQLFDVNKIFYVKLTKWKDANEALQDDPAELKRCWWNAKKYQPKEIVSDFSAIEGILKEEDTQAIGSYPFPSLDAMAYGIRSGEMVLFTALEKVGKTEVLRAIEHHLLKTTSENIGIIHLEERTKRSVQGLIGYELGLPAHLPDSGISNIDSIEAYKKLVGGDSRCYFYNHFGSEDPGVILDAIRYLVSVNHCKFIFLDHITLLVTGYEDEDERKKLDYISTRLAMMTRELDFTLFMVSHVNDSGQTRGSRNIAKVADLIIHLERDLGSESVDTRNTTTLQCRGNRYAGITGPAGRLHFNAKSFTLREYDTIPSDAHELAQAKVLDVVQGQQPSLAHPGLGPTSYCITLQMPELTQGSSQGSHPWAGSVS